MVFHSHLNAMYLTLSLFPLFQKNRRCRLPLSESLGGMDKHQSFTLRVLSFRGMSDGPLDIRNPVPGSATITRYL